MPPKGGEVAQSVEESNALRAKLGIKPLKEADKGKAGTSNQPVHAPADEKKGPSEKDNKKKAAAAKAKKDHAELTAGEGLGDILGREEKGNAADWIAKTRGSDGSMKGAGEKLKEDSKKRKDAPGTDTVPKMKVRHDSSALQEGESVIMTLSDQRLLDKDGNLVEGQDELSNVNMMDSEKNKQNDAIRAQVAYDPTKQGADILDKYDEIKTGPTGFMIGGVATGVIEERNPEKRLDILTKIAEQQDVKLNFQSDYYTSEEMSKFKKPTKKIKKKSRNKAGGDREDQIGDPTKVHTKIARPEDAGSDEEDPELYEQLSKQRRLAKKTDTQGATKKGEAALTQVSEQVSTLNDEEEEKKESREKEILGKKTTDGETVALTATTEFCNVVQTPLEKTETLKHESFRGSTLYKQQATTKKGIAAGEKRARKAGLAPNAEEISATKEMEEDLEQTLNEEGLDLSCASGLEYLRARSQIGGDQETHRIRKLDNRPLEMSTLDGDIKLEYRDDYGRVQTPKEAFRAISWKFHGKVPGRKNMERRLLRLENEMRLKSMNAEESLPTLRALRHVQIQEAKPFMVLSGANEK
mmetsp:Transcript_89264/g.158311  ORF Transcript_89264/g.158311 Transcript_89264/m.158311 type:complete len:582 (-) Transcript_89264:85-1830(-)|eukprot:CAMPEP_0197651066 /NCGR_PEP_ID=MMETSP1338-20131121/31329_1 /TAXON_ID=43686 ORGANISM="Pelagodinium beii, Strain RCC1491" /NCGR_SAMPLE_ID=MMETSP1338 /ASSEMBLY_ACC=CAM_ASM_000754 /LENGTH=581 /DNA_ID=CAMNT_0043225617 /DNA_START=67 /DNA_END=1812 /DNA_ORIENTATION=-